MDNTTVNPDVGSAMAAIMGMMLVWGIVGLAVTVFFIWCFWRIFTKAGMSGALALLNLIPFVGGLIVLLILAFGEWPNSPSKSAVSVQPGYSPPTAT
jgi:uncharacterized membrane protein YhaH (DUF805 family)